MSGRTYFHQKIYDPTTFPWTKLFDSATPAPFFPIVPQVADSVVATSTMTAAWTSFC